MMDALRIAKDRARGRRDQSGAAMFIVAMTLAVLASVGVYALAAAATEVKTSGYERQNTQTHYLTQYAIIGAAHYLAASNVQLTYGLMANPTSRDNCPLSLPGVGTGLDTMIAGCRRVPAQEMRDTSAWAIAHPLDSYTGTAPLQSNVQPGSFGPTLMTGDFYVELTEPWQPKAPAGYALNLSMCFYEFTATASGITEPQYPGATDTATPAFGGEGVEVQRARLVAGPTKCSK